MKEALLSVEKDWIVNILQMQETMSDLEVKPFNIQACISFQEHFRTLGDL